MRQVSKKRQALMRKAKPVRDALRAEVGRCEICGTTKGRLDIHEICRGVHRQVALDKRFALLVVCRACHEELGSASQWPEARQLAVLARSRSLDFSLSDFLDLTNPRAPRRIEMEEVLAWLMR
jgi:ribosomal protein S14